MGISQAAVYFGSQFHNMHQQPRTLENLVSNLGEEVYTVSDSVKCLELFKCPKYDNGYSTVL